MNRGFRNTGVALGLLASACIGSGESAPPEVASAVLASSQTVEGREGLTGIEEVLDFPYQETALISAEGLSTRLGSFGDARPLNEQDIHYFQNAFRTLADSTNFLQIHAQAVVEGVEDKHYTAQLKSRDLDVAMFAVEQHHFASTDIASFAATAATIATKSTVVSYIDTGLSDLEPTRRLEAVEVCQSLTEVVIDEIEPGFGNEIYCNVIGEAIAFAHEGLPYDEYEADIIDQIPYTAVLNPVSDSQFAVQLIGLVSREVYERFKEGDFSIALQASDVIFPEIAS